MTLGWLFYLAVVTLVLTVATAIEFAVGNRTFRALATVPPLNDASSPRVSIIIAARNESRKIEPALQSVLAQDYPNYEIIVVNDRSTDDTGEIVRRMAASEQSMRVITVNELPPRWLGKNHALNAGAGQATGELLLFTDADVMMETTTLGRAVNMLRISGLDHLAVTPRMAMPGVFLNMFGGAFTIFFGLYAKPWKARDPKSRRHIGIGAFNLIRAEVYRRIGGHSSIAMRPDDDIRLGKIIKTAGYRQDMALGNKLLRVEWYSSVGEIVRGLDKNTFAGVDYNLAVVIAASIGQWAVFVWPVAALFLTSGPTWWLNAAIAAVIGLLYADNAGFHGMKRRHWIGFPVATALFQYTIWRAVLKTLLNGGIDWRGTHYSLADLKGNK
jgi:glycosyltransferase involved in cell wall biosynthesis